MALTRCRDTFYPETGTSYCRSPIGWSKSKCSVILEYFCTFRKFFNYIFKNDCQKCQKCFAKNVQFLMIGPPPTCSPNSIHQEAVLLMSRTGAYPARYPARVTRTYKMGSSFLFLGKIRNNIAEPGIPGLRRNPENSSKFPEWTRICPSFDSEPGNSDFRKMSALFSVQIAIFTTIFGSELGMLV